MARFGRIWPGKWQDQAEQAGGMEALVEEWQLGLHGLSGEQIKRGIAHCRQHATWPPSIAEFRQACTDGSTLEQRAFQARADADAQLALPSETSAEARERNRCRLAELMAIVKGAETRSEGAEAAPEVRPHQG